MSLDSSSVSVVVVSHNEGDKLHSTIHHLLSRLPKGGEVIVVDDASEDNSGVEAARKYPAARILRPPQRLGAARARNYGAVHAQGEWLIFSDAHVEPKDPWAKWFAEALKYPQVGAVAPMVSVMGAPERKGFGMRWKDAALNTDWMSDPKTTPARSPLLPGCFLGMRREVWKQVGGFDDGLVVWGMEDSELSYRLWSLGYECWLLPNVDVAHFFRKAHPYKVESEIFIHNVLRVATIHFSGARLHAVIRALGNHPSFPGAYERLLGSDAIKRRKQLERVRKTNDDWFFGQFQMGW